MLGRSPQKRGPLLGAKSLMDRLGELAPDLDIYIIPDQVQRPARHSWQPYLLQERFSVRDLSWLPAPPWAFSSSERAFPLKM